MERGFLHLDTPRDLPDYRCCQYTRRPTYGHDIVPDVIARRARFATKATREGSHLELRNQVRIALCDLLLTSGLVDRCRRSASLLQILHLPFGLVNWLARRSDADNCLKMSGLQQGHLAIRGQPKRLVVSTQPGNFDLILACMGVTGATAIGKHLVLRAVRICRAESLIVRSSDATSAAIQSENNEFEGTRVKDALDRLASHRRVGGVHHIIIIVQNLPNWRQKPAMFPHDVQRFLKQRNGVIAEGPNTPSEASQEPERLDDERHGRLECVG
mmetsp:Transcript_82676/g.183653  ORF Transcript_82676/g.183653 Transcript_82676/m.183653 type:complete len:272 (-) Transcript_82676:47-862(-)